MDDRLVQETQLDDTFVKSKHELRQDEVVARGFHITTEAVEETPALSPAIQALIQRCMDGSESFDCGHGEERLYWQQQKFNPQHLQVVMTRIAGFKNIEIARMFGLEHARVCVILKHPYAKKIIQAIIPQMGTRVLDIRTKLEMRASALLDHVFKLAIVSEDVKEVAAVTFGFLDRAGYNPVNKSAAVNLAPKDLRSMGESAMSRLASAMEESNSINAVMATYQVSVPPESNEVASDGRYTVIDSVPGSGGFPAQDPDNPAQPEELRSAPKGFQRTGTNN